nr:YiaA/YiaB family inner membrane protein [Hymenobacter crusticola]
MPAQILTNQQPSGVFIAASWVALLAGAVSYNVRLWNAQMPLNKKGYYFTVLMYGLFSAVSVQKSVRDRMECYAYAQRKRMLRYVFPA